MRWPSTCESTDLGDWSDAQLDDSSIPFHLVLRALVAVSLSLAQDPVASLDVFSCIILTAGGQHATEVARLLNIGTVLIHRHSSILSAYGLALADR